MVTNRLLLSAFLLIIPLFSFLTTGESNVVVLLKSDVYIPPVRGDPGRVTPLMALIDFAMHFENDHIGIARQKDAAYHIFKNAVEDIVDCPVPARKQKEALEKELNRTINRLDAENKAFDIPGGPHDVHIPASLNL